jgi:hypothetical protein
LPARLEAVSEAWVRSGCSVPPLERLLVHDMTQRWADQGQWTGTVPFNRFLVRPGSEAILSELWSTMAGGPTTDTLVEHLIAGLTGAPPDIRSGQITSAPDRSGRRTVYAPPDIAGGWIKRVNAAEMTVGDPYILACHAYAEVALSHPYADGNGRLARAMFQRAFARAGLLEAPLIPLGPLIYLNHKVVIQALVRLGTTDDWAPFLALMARLTHTALDFAEHRLKRFARPSVHGIDGP